MTRNTDTTTMHDQDLATAAGRGDQRAFDELHRRHAALAWRLALAVTGRPDDATAATVEGTGATFTAMRAGRLPASNPGISLATASRNAALDLRRTQDAIAAPIPADDADPFLATAFGALPERWRSVLWLRDAEALNASQVAPVVELTPDAVDQLAVRARRGLRERYLKAQVATAGDRTCSRAVARLGALEDGTLSAADQANLERHLEGCEACTERRAAVAAIPTSLASLAAAPPADLLERSRASWTAALATTSSTGLSPRTEKVLAGVSAFAAAVGVLGAALFGTGGDDEPVASPLAPLVADIDAPRPVDLSELTLPITTPDPVATRARRAVSVDSVTNTLSPRTSPSAGATEVAAPAVPGAAPAPAPTPAPGSTPTQPTPAVEGPSSALPGLGDVPIAVNLGEETNVNVGPVTVDLDPETTQPPLTLDTPEQLDPVVKPVEKIVNTVVEPVTKVLDPVLQAAEPITTGVDQVIGRIGLGG